MNEKRNYLEIGFYSWIAISLLAAIFKTVGVLPIHWGWVGLIIIAPPIMFVLMIWLAVIL